MIILEFGKRKPAYSCIPLFKTMWIIIKRTCLNCQTIIRVVPWFRFLYLHSVPIRSLWLKVSSSAKKISSLQKEMFVWMCLSTCQSFSDISWQNFGTNLEIFCKLEAFGDVLNVRSLLTLWPCKMVTMATAEYWNGGWGERLMWKK